MPIKIPNGLPATQILQRENIFIMDERRAASQDIRPLEVLLLNLMPTKLVTEAQFARLLGNTPLQLNLELLKTTTHVATHVDEEHMVTFYKSFDQIRHRKFDCMVITGAPVEKLAFEDVDYWRELCEIMEWSKTHVFSTLHICWGAQAGLYYHFGIPKREMRAKLFGVYPHTVEDQRNILFRGFDDTFMVPHSRYTTVDRSDIAGVGELDILASSPEAGVLAVMKRNFRQIFVMGHMEYDWDTLLREYLRDKDQGLDTAMPKNYFPREDDAQKPVVTWRSSAALFFANWLNYVYQETPYNIQDIK